MSFESFSTLTVPDLQPASIIKSPSFQKTNLLYKPYPTRVCVLVTQSCLTLCDPMDCSSSGSSVPGISEERILDWVAIPFLWDITDPGIK